MSRSELLMLCCSCLGERLVLVHGVLLGVERHLVGHLVPLVPESGGQLVVHVCEHQVRGGLLTKVCCLEGLHHLKRMEGWIDIHLYVKWDTLL